MASKKIRFVPNAILSVCPKKTEITPLNVVKLAAMRQVLEFRRPDGSLVMSVEKPFAAVNLAT